MPKDAENNQKLSCYITMDSQIPPFLPYPVFLLDLKISMTAKAVYALLLNRSNLSRMNEWKDARGRVYIIYPIDAIAADMHRSKTAIKNALNELEKCGLLERCRTATGKANRLYVKYLKTSNGRRIEPHSNTQRTALDEKTDARQRGFGDMTADEDSTSDNEIKESSEEVKKLPLTKAGKLPLYRSGNSPPRRQISASDTGSILPPNNKKELPDNSHLMEGKGRNIFGRYNNIVLSQREYAALAADYPVDLSRYLEEVSCHLEATGRTYQNFEAGIRSWAAKDYRKAIEPKSTNYDYTVVPKYDG